MEAIAQYFELGIEQLRIVAQSRPHSDRLKLVLQILWLYGTC
jgi:hypothetical protein